QRRLDTPSHWFRVAAGAWVSVDGVCDGMMTKVPVSTHRACVRFQYWRDDVSSGVITTRIPEKTLIPPDGDGRGATPACPEPRCAVPRANGGRGRTVVAPVLRLPPVASASSPVPMPR